MSRVPVEVVRLRRLDRGQVRAVATLRIGPLVVAGVRLLGDPADNKVWTAMPQVPVRHRPDGSGSGWQAVIKISNPALLRDVAHVLLQAWRSGCAS